MPTITGDAPEMASRTLNASGRPDPDGLGDLWAQTLGDPSVCVAVLDGPVDLSHPCFHGARLTLLDTLVPGAADAGPASQHGTHIASVIFGCHDGPVRGIAPGCRGLIVPVFTDGDGRELAPCSQLDLARAITQAVQHGANVINISGGQFDPSGEAHPYLVNAVRACAKSGVTIVAAAGNEGCACLHVPAALSTVIAVGAMDADGNPLAFSNWGEAYQANGILAPGDRILGAVPGGGTASRSGTSYATPVVAGVVALLLSLQLKRRGRLDPDPVRQALIGGAIGCEERPIPNCDRLLAGRLNITGTLTHLIQEGTTAMAEANENQETEAVEPWLGDAGSPEAGPSEEREAGSRPVASASNSGPQACCPPYATPGGMSSPTAGNVLPSADPGGSASLVYALGQVGHDFGTEARHDSFVQLGIANPRDPGDLLTHLERSPAHAAGVTWTLNQESTAIYAVQPGGPFGAEGYALLREFLGDQLKEGAEQVSIPGIVSGSARLLNGQVVPVIHPDVRGMYSWSTPALVKAVLGRPPAKSRRSELEAYQREAEEIGDFLHRVYYELRNLGTSPQDRAINFAATNAFQAGAVYREAIKAEMKLDTIGVERSPICRPESDCWDVRLTFFNPSKRQQQARLVYRFTVDVSDVVPVTIGQTRRWHVY